MCLLFVIYRQLFDSASFNASRKPTFNVGNMGNLLFLVSFCECNMLCNLHAAKFPREHDFAGQNFVLLGCF
jgi:hypothetical protein